MSFTNEPHQSTEPITDEGNESDAGEGKVTLNRQQIRSMERDAAKARVLEKENAFLKAGVDVASPLGALLFQGYNGELEVEAIKAAWDALPHAPVTEASTEPPAGEATPPVSQEQGEQQTRERQELAQGGVVDTGEPPEVDPRKQALEKAEQVLAQGGTREEAGATMFSELAQAASRGDRRVIIE